MNKISLILKSLIWIALYYFISCVSVLVIVKSGIINNFSNPTIINLLIKNLTTIPFIIYFIYKNYKTKQIIKPCTIENTYIICSGAIWYYLTLSGLIVLLINVLPTNISSIISTSGILISNDTYSLLGFVTLVIFVPIAEETVFRLGIQKCLCKISPTFSIIAQAVIFAVFHTGPIQIGYALISGLLLGYIYYKSNYNLSTCIGFHMIFNAVPFLIWMLGYQGDITLLAICIVLSYIAYTIKREQLNILDPLYKKGIVG